MKRCPFCAEEIQDAAIKCRHCNSMLDGSAPAGGAAPAGNAARGLVGGGGGGGAQVRDVAAVPLFEGVPSWKARFWSYAGAALAVALGVALMPGLHMVRPIEVDWTTSVIVGGSLLAVGLVWMGANTLIRRSTHFRISTRTIDVETGILSKNIETLQLWKVRDLEFQQSFMDRILNVAHIKVITHDVTTPELMLWGLPESREIFERLKNAIDLARQSRNVVGVVE